MAQAGNEWCDIIYRWLLPQRGIADAHNSVHDKHAENLQVHLSWLETVVVSSRSLENLCAG